MIDPFPFSLLIEVRDNTQFKLKHHWTPMEEHLILKLDGPIKAKIEADLSNRKTDFYIERISDRDYILNYKGEIVNLKMVDLPCIVESHKSINKQQFKVCDISQMLVVDDRSKDGYGVEEDSGLTPPMRYVRYRRFRKRHNRYNMIEIEKKVAELIEKDMKASDVEVIIGSNGQSIEKNDKVKRGKYKINKEKNLNPRSGSEIKEIYTDINDGYKKVKGGEKVKGGDKMLKGSDNKVGCSNKMVNDSDEIVKGSDKMDLVVDNASKHEDFITSVKNNENKLSDDSLSDFAAELESGVINENEYQELMEKRQELDEIEKKLKHKEEQMSSAINSIIKKRFMESLNQLKKEYEECKKEIEKLERHN